MRTRVGVGFVLPPRPRRAAPTRPRRARPRRRPTPSAPGASRHGPVSVARQSRLPPWLFGSPSEHHPRLRGARNRTAPKSRRALAGLNPQTYGGASRQGDGSLSVREGSRVTVASADLPTHASVVVIGGGVIGLSTAYHLARAGVERRGAGRAGRVRVRVHLQGGRRSARASSPTRSTSSSACAACETFENFKARARPGDRPAPGRLPVPARPARRTSRRSRRTWRCRTSSACTSRMIDVAEAKRLSPLIDTDGLLAAAWSPRDGHCTPESVVLGYAGAARRAGARLVRGCPVTGIADRRRHHHRGGDQPRHHQDRHRHLCGGRLVHASSASMVGVDLPVRAAAAADPDDRADAGSRPAHAVHDRLLDQLLLPRRGPRPPARHVRPRRDARLQARPVRRLAAAARRGDRAPGAGRSPRSASPAGGPGSTR